MYGCQVDVIETLLGNSVDDLTTNVPIHEIFFANKIVKECDVSGVIKKLYETLLKHAFVKFHLLAIILGCISVIGWYKNSLSVRVE